MSKRFTEGICGDGATILDNGKPITITEILKNLNKLDELEQLSLLSVMDRLPESDYIRQQAQQMDEKEFEKWWWETVYKGN